MNLATKKWIFLKISSVILLPLMFWFAVNFVKVYDSNIQICRIFY
jgi:succinate dehydrogenase / fumarate reductase membrane anchor subunit